MLGADADLDFDYGEYGRLSVVESALSNVVQHVHYVLLCVVRYVGKFADESEK